MACTKAKSMRFRVYKIEPNKSGLSIHDPRMCSDIVGEFDVISPDDTLPFSLRYYKRPGDVGITDYSIASVILGKAFDFHGKYVDGAAVSWSGEGQFISGAIYEWCYIRRVV